MKAASLIEVITAAHFTSYVDSEEFPERGGIILNSPPGNFKSTFIKQCLKPYCPQALVLSDINVETFTLLKHSMSTGALRTLALPELQKIYERNPQTAKNVEGHIRGIVDEGFGLASFQNQQMLGQVEARCMVICGIVPSCYERHFQQWTDSGFTRRFIWSSYQLADPSVLTQAIHKWKRLEFREKTPMLPQKRIHMNVTESESKEIMHIMGQQGCEALPYSLLKKILAVLKWKFRERAEAREPMRIIRDFGKSLGTKMDKLEL